MSKHSGGRYNDRNHDRNINTGSPIRSQIVTPSYGSPKEKDSSKEAGIFNLFRERGMLGGPSSPSGLNGGGIYNPITFKVEPIPEQNIRNILLINQQQQQTTVATHDSDGNGNDIQTLLDELDYHHHFYPAMITGSGSGGSTTSKSASAPIIPTPTPTPISSGIYNSYNTSHVQEWTSKVFANLISPTGSLTGSPNRPGSGPNSTEKAKSLSVSAFPDGTILGVEGSMTSLSLDGSSSSSSPSALTSTSASTATSIVDILISATSGPLTPSQQTVIIESIRGNIVLEEVPNTTITTNNNAKKERRRNKSDPPSSTSVMKKILKNPISGEPVGASQLLALSKITPDMYPLLVESSPVIAYECINNLLCSKENQLCSLYLDSLISMETSLQTMEVVTRLTTVSSSSSSSGSGSGSGSNTDGKSAGTITSTNTSVQVPKEFIHSYISNCIKCCENNKDKYMQNRLVRIVCAFFQSLIRNNVVNIKDISFQTTLTESLQFCIEYSKIKEASVLFRMLKDGSS